MKQIILTILAIVLLASCSCKPVIVEPVKLPIPAKPALPTIQPEALACLSQTTYAKLAEREARIADYAKQCRAILESTQ